MMCYIKQHISEYILAEVYDVSPVRVCSLLNECCVVLFRWIVSSAHLRVERLSQVQEQIKDLFRQYFVHFLRIPEVGIAEHKSFRGNSYAKLCCM